jgi:medium-chain acyl-[acyl-carrier-protein] hydrolase
LLCVAARRAPKLPDSSEQIHRLSDDDFLEAVARLNGTSAELLNDREAMRTFLPLLRADFEAAETYQYRAEPQLDCPITVFGGRDDVGAEELSAWRDETKSEFRMILLPGHHFFVHTSRDAFLSALADELTSHIPE